MKGSTMSDDTLLHEVTGSGNPIVLVPGILTGWASWVAPAEQLATHRKVVRVQVRLIELVEAGEPIPETHGIDTERDALLATVDALGLDRFDLVGWSLGGLVSLAFAFEHPERIRTLTLIEPPAAWILRETGHAAAARARDEAFDRSFAHCDISIDDLKAFLVRGGFGEPGTDFESHPRWPVMARNRQSLSMLGAINDYTDSLDRLRTLDVPILAVKGTETTEWCATIVDDIVASAPNATLLELPGGHACHIENIDRFIEELERHLSGAMAR